MAGTKAGAAKARDTNIARYGKDFYGRIGHIGGANGSTGGFASDKVGKDGLTGRERAIVAGAKGGTNSRRGPSKKTTAEREQDGERQSVGSETYGTSRTN